MITFPSLGGSWRFFDIVEGRNNRIQEWYQGDLLVEGRYAFDALLKNTAKISNHLQWGNKFKYLKGEARKERIWQLDFVADKRQYRLLGIFRPQRQAVLLIGCYHKGKVYAPPDAIELASKRASALREGRASISERSIRYDL